MIKLLFIGDRHNIERAPYSRIDDFQESCDAKDDEIIKIAKDHNVAAILQPGDFWTDSDKRPSNEFITKTALKWMKCGIPIIGIAGNHDIIGGNIGSLPLTVCGMMNSLGIMKIINSGEIVEFSDGEITIGLSGTNYHKNMDKKECIDDYIVKDKTTDYRIHMVHGMLTPYDMGTLYRHTKIDDIKHTDADITLCGHDHCGFGVIDYNGKLFCNPGAVVRLSCSEKELNRTIQVALITADKNGINIELIPLKSAKPGNEVLTRSKIEQEEINTSYIEFVKNGVQKLNIGSGVSMTDVLEDIYNRDEIDADLRKSINKTIEDKTKSTKQQICNPPTGTEITKLIIENFQSHENTIIDFDTGFNVIIGESHQGKSAILRAIRWVADNKPAGKGVIRIGAKQAKVQINLKNGTIIQRYISTSSSAKDNGYKIYFPDGTIQEGNTKMLPDVRRVMGWSNMIIGDGEELPLNHLRQGDSWYLIGDAYTGSDRARILGAIHNTDGADAAIKDFDKENGRIADSIKTENVEIENQLAELEDKQIIKEDKIIFKSVIEKLILIERINDYKSCLNDFNTRNNILERIDYCFNEAVIVQNIMNATNAIERFKNVKAKFELIGKEKQRIVFADRTIHEVSRLDDIDRVMQSASLNLDKINNIVKLSRTQTEASDNINKHTNAINLIDRIDTNVFQSLTQNVQTLNVVKTRLESLKKAKRAITVADRFIEQCSGMDKFEHAKKTISDLVDRSINITSWCEKYKNAKTEEQKAEKWCIDSENKYAESINKKAEILKNNHVCPTCMSTIDDSTIEKIKNEMNKE